MPVIEKYPTSKLIGLSGTFCSGKDTAASHLVKHHNFMHISTGNVLRDEATKTGSNHQRETLIEIAVRLRKEYGSIGALVIKAIDQWEEEREAFCGGVVVSGLRVLGEAQELTLQAVTLVFVDAPAEVRFDRQRKRAINTGRVVDTVNTLEEFIQSEKPELEGLGGPERPNLRAIRSIADIQIWNDGTEGDYLKKIDSLLYP